MGLGLVVLALAAAGLAPSESPRELLPDFDQRAPSVISVKHHEGRDVLAFASAVDNLGAGPLLLVGHRPSVTTPTMRVTQVVERSDGTTRAIRIRARLRYERAPTHAHWHLIGFERYELLAADGSGAPLRSRKRGFCLGDRYDSKPFRRLPGEPAKKVWTGQCGRGSPRLLVVEEGMSVGYGDNYGPLREGQYVDLTGVPAGRYVLVHTANPRRAIRESDYRNNAASVLLELRRVGPDAVPVVDVLRRCPGSATCA